MQRPFRFGIVCEEMTDREAWIANYMFADQFIEMAAPLIKYLK